MAFPLKLEKNNCCNVCLLIRESQELSWDSFGKNLSKTDK